MINKKPIIKRIKPIVKKRQIIKKKLVNKKTPKITLKTGNKKVAKKIIKKTINKKSINKKTISKKTIKRKLKSLTNNRTFIKPKNKKIVRPISNRRKIIVKKIITRKINNTTTNNLPNTSNYISKNNLVSVIIPSYNCAKYIIKTIQSVVSQTYPNWEIIVIDDYSRDNTSKIVSEYITNNHLEDKIKLITNTKNRGCYVSFNVGIQNASGEYICILGSDDTYDKNKLMIQSKTLDNNNKYVCTMSYYRREKRVIKRNRMTVCTMMIRKQVIDKIGYFDSVRYSADDEFMKRLMRTYGRGRVNMLPRVLYYAIRRVGSLTQSKKTGYGTTHRKRYWQLAQNWHRSGKKLYIPFPLKKRPFPAPKAILGS